MSSVVNLPSGPDQDISKFLSGMSFHGPYEDAIIEVARTVREIIQGQDPEFRREMGQRFLDSTKPLHDLSVQIGTQLSQWLAAIAKK